MRDPRFAGFFSSTAAVGPLPFPSGPWQPRQLATYSFLPNAIALAFGGTGFGRLAAEAGARQSGFCAKANVLAETSPSAAKTLRKKLDRLDVFTIRQLRLHFANVARM